MGFRINTNVQSLNAQANSALTNRALDKSLSRLSSGLRINSAADDASGMVIADSLRTQANTLGQAISNGNDALGIMQTADKAMDEQIKILDTIKVKATQAAQDGQTSKTRETIQADINRLMEELDNIANTTSFNGKQLLSGSFVNQEFQIGASSNQTIKSTIGDTNSSKIGLTRFETGDNIKASGTASMTIKQFNGIDDFTFKDVIISTSVGTGIGALAEEINKSADKTGVRANFKVETTGVISVKEGSTGDKFEINGVIIGKVDFKDNDGNGSLVSAINAVKDTTGVEASITDTGKLKLTSRDGRGIEIKDMGEGRKSGIIAQQDNNYGRLSIVKNDGRDIAVEGNGFGFSTKVAQNTISLRESKGIISEGAAEAMGFNATFGGAVFVSGAGVSGYMEAAGNGFSVGSGFSIGSGKSMSVILNQAVVDGSVAAFSNNVSDLAQYLTVSTGSGFSTGSGQSQFAAMKTSKLGTEQTAGVTTLKGAMAVMDIADTAITNLDKIRADIGSVQNQITATLNNITVTQVNVKSAESNIRDVDFAAESANFSKNNILAQSGSYALTQANAAQQQVLRLLQ